MAEEQADQELVPQKSGKGKLIIIAVIAFLILAAGGFLAYTMLMGGDEEAEGEEGQEEEVVEEVAVEEGPGILVEVPSFVVNLAEPGRYIKVDIQLEIGTIEDQELILQLEPKVRDAILILLTSKTIDSLSGPEGKFQLKDEILLRVNQTLGKDIIRNVYFTQFVIQ